MDALLELRGQLRKLQWYGEVNRRGFIKITKKLDKKIDGVSTQQRYLAAKVNPKPFAHNLPLNQDMKVVNEWLSGLGDIKTFDDSGSTHSAASLGRVPGRALNIPSGVLDSVDQAIRNDEADTLATLISNIAGTNDSGSTAFQQTLLNFLQRAISCRSKACIDKLLPDIVSLEEEDDINKRNCIHRLVITIGRTKSGTNALEGPSLQPSSEPYFITPAATPNRQLQPCTNTEEESSHLLSRNDESVGLLVHLLDQLEPRQRSSLQSRDTYGRLPLHYAAQYGFVVMCQEVIKHMQDWDQFNVSQGIDSPYWQDAEGYAPLHVAVIGGHALTTKALLQAENWRGESNEKFTCRKTISQSGAALSLATQSNFVTIVKLLVEAGVDVNHQNEQGEAALHIAARYGHEECAKALLVGSSLYKTNIEIVDNTFAWTPLFVACIEGHVPMAELLVKSGASLERQDSSGWTAKEHAALRGHMDVVSKLDEVAPSPMPIQVEGRVPSTQSSSLKEHRSKNLGRENSSYQKAPEPVKTFGHRYLTKETMVLVSLGSMDTRKDISAVKLDDIPMANAHATQLDTALSVVVSATGALGEPTVVDLPVQDNISTDPITFMTTDISKVKLLFDIVPTYAGANDRIVGRGVALLSTIKTSIGSKRIPLQGDVSVPIIAASTLDVIGTVNFNFLIITPFSHPNLSITEQQTYWKKMASTMVIGHRGLGKNTEARNSLQLGENTIQSFIAAANLGASYVEFDVQLTKDHVPVIYHDFLVAETGIDAPVHTLTLEQFLHVSAGQTPRQSRPGSPEHSKMMDTGTTEKPSQRRLRSYSMDNSQQKNLHANHQMDLTERMKHTRAMKKKGYKGNSRGNFIQAPFTTLEEMFKKLPESTGFNIEMKYPMLHESEEEEMDQFAVELNSFVDTVLQMVYDCSGKRNIMFSSFNPDICLILSFKQPSIPVLFLTDAGTSPVGDVRAASLQEAIRFASRWNLLGIVSNAEPLVKCPRLVRVVKESGLVCFSYGTLNNDPKNVKVSRRFKMGVGSCPNHAQVQEKEGIDAVIVDNVLAVRKGLTAPVQDTESVTGSATSGPTNSLTASTDPSVAPSSEASEASSEAAEQNGTEASTGIAIRVNDGAGKTADIVPR